MFARADLLRVTMGVAGGVDLVTALVFFTGLTTALVALGSLARCLLWSLRFLHGVFPPWNSRTIRDRERSKAKLLEPSAQISKRSNSPAPAKQVPEPEPHFPGLWKGNRLLGSRSKLPGLGKLQIPEPLPGEL